ncbi:dermonecrotic toxin domain-containing protein [Pseudomonas sp. D2002]|uniref:dermonecrotic toxin domain-containing protein n=1 Tax=Pseudomonas sp. D2002 TaxID=2726980 RepID=UPI0015A02D66|nr:DUF6543 domain-containing protein [Pseudomonas sp. D2002]NWA86642.1 hypothetical protein [Pseudomonas sp. D2002]
MSTDTTAGLAAEAAWADTLDFDDPNTSSADRDAAIRVLLTRRLNAVMQPSAEINRLYEAQTRGSKAAKALSGLIGRAPRVLGILRGALREAFGLDPDTVLFSEPRPPALTQRIDSLTERALGLLIQPYVPLNINQFTALSVKDDPSRPLPFTAREALERINGLALLGRLDAAMRAYWQQLAQGSWLTRKQHWAQLRKSVFAENALLAHQVYQLSDNGFAMLRQLMELPGADARRRAGGEWACIQVSRVAWPGTNQALVPIPGALHIYREGVVGDTPHVIYLPGLSREFYEFSSWHRLQCDLPVLVNGPLSRVLWQCLPLRRWHELCDTPSATPSAFTLQLIGPHQEDALLASATELLEAQWDNELACALSINPAAVGIQGAGQSAAPDVKRLLKYIQKGRSRLVGFARLGSTLNTLLEWDQRRRAGEIAFGSLASGLGLNTREALLKRYEKGLVALLDATDIANDSAAFQEVLDLERQWQEQVETARKWAHGPHERLLQKAFWLEKPKGALSRGSLLGGAQRRALLYEAQMQQRLNLITPAHLQLVNAALSESWVPGQQPTDTCVLQVAVGGEAASLYPLLGAVLVTTNAARAQPAGRHPVVLYVMGQQGGLVPFDSLDAFADGLQASLKSRDGFMLWRCIGRHQRAQLRAAISALPKGTPLVSYTLIERNVLKDLFLNLLQHYQALQKRVDQGERLFSEVSDPQLSAMLLAQELFECLQIPANDARTLALANVNLLQEAARQAKKLPAWLGIASTGQRKHYKQLSRRYLANAWAVENKLWQDLPDLEAFARDALIARLSEDGFYPQLDIDKPLLDLPDDVSSQLCGWSSQCAVGDRDVKMVVSPQRTTFSLLQLALHNLDPKAPWTRWRLNRARWLDPHWKDRLSVAYLIKMIASLDVGGEYDKHIQRAFYPPVSTSGASTGLSQALVYRALQQRAEMQLYSAVQEGLSDAAQRLFTFAMAARSAGDLQADGFDVQLAVLRLVGVTLEQDRHIAGVLLIHDKLSGLCVVYWPTALASRVIVGYASLVEAERALNRLGALPDNLKVLARQVAPGWESEALDHYPGEDHGVSPRRRFSGRLGIVAMERVVSWVAEFFTVRHKVPAVAQDSVEAQIKEQIALLPQAWLAAVPTSGGNAMALLAHAQVFDLQRRTQAQSQSAQALQEYREQRLGEQYDATIRGLLSFVPVLGIGASLYEMLLAARRYHFSGSAHDAVDVAFLTVLSFVDVLLTFAPGPKGASAARASLAPVHRHQGFARAGLKVAPSRPLNLLERFRSSGGLEGAIELQGPGGKGRYVKNGQRLLVEGDEVYPVYQRENEWGLRLRNPQVEAPEELILNIHQSREWLLGADAPQPMPDLLRPWSVLDQPSDWRPPAVRTATQNRILQSSASNSHWLHWRISLQGTASPNAAAPGIFRIASDPGALSFNALRVAPPDPQSGYYRLLPQGDQAPLNQIVFIHKNEPLSLARTDIERWASTALHEQPIPVSRNPAGTWRIHEPLFDRSLTDYVGTAFPTLTPKSREFAVARMIELTGPSAPATAGHLLALRATFDDWLPPAPARPGQTDDLLRMLRPNDRRKPFLYIGYEGKAPGFMRVDFIPPFALDPRLKFGVVPDKVWLRQQRLAALRAAAREVLERQGFIVQDVSVARTRGLNQESILSHPRSNKLYYVSYEWVETGRLMFRTKLTDKWITEAINAHGTSTLAGVSSAMRERRLERICAGIQWPVKGMLNPTVYFVKVNP